MGETRGFEILPAIDLRGGRVVRLRQGNFGQETGYSDDPAAVARGFADAGARWLHVVDLDAARTGRPSNGGAIDAIVAAVGAGVQIEVAGGLRDTAAVAAVLSSGAARAVIGTAALREPGFAGDLVGAHGRERIAVAIDVRDGRAIGQGWVRSAISADAAEMVGRLADIGVTTFEVTAIDRDGLLAGPDLALYGKLVAPGRGAIIASGGIASIQDLIDVRALGCAGAIVGRALYEGRLDLRVALELAAAIGLTDPSD
jgi:phosphoribosylformimino-5-aminoimidazole carboxamide ribotide isomerase